MLMGDWVSFPRGQNLGPQLDNHLRSHISHLPLLCAVRTADIADRSGRKLENQALDEVCCN